MRAVETQWWILELPEEWDAEQEDEAVVVADRDGVGEIVITTLQKTAGEVGEAELADASALVVAEHGAGEAVKLGQAQGYYFSFQEQGEALREWYLRSDDLLILITYSCDSDNAGLDDSAVDEILSTLYIKTHQERDAEHTP